MWMLTTVCHQYMIQQVNELEFNRRMAMFTAFLNGCEWTIVTPFTTWE